MGEIIRKQRDADLLRYGLNEAVLNGWKELVLLLNCLVCIINLPPQAIHIQRVGDLVHDFL